MGGFGSGRQDGRALVEDCLTLDIAGLVRDGLIVPGGRSAVRPSRMAISRAGAPPLASRHSSASSSAVQGFPAFGLRTRGDGSSGAMAASPSPPAGAAGARARRPPKGRGGSARSGARRRARTP